MGSFPAQARRVRADDLELSGRLWALRECVLHFAPYGFRATWHHLVVNAGIPQSLKRDPRSLVRAVDELEEARLLWNAQWRAYAARRRVEKATGRRTPRKSDRWLSWRGMLAPCPDPEVHPSGRLAVVVSRLITVYSSGSVRARTCPVCGREAQPCPSCGIDARSPAEVRWITGLDAERRWKQIWRRAFVGAPNASDQMATDVAQSRERRRRQ